MLSWLLIAALGMIWVVFLIPSRRRSPASSVEEFEEKMSMLAEANKGSVGRWVLMPPKGRRIVTSQRPNVRARRRRKFVFVALLDVGALTLLMGLFPPFRVMLLGTAIVAFLLLVYTALLVKLHTDDVARARALARRSRVAPTRRYATNGNGYAEPVRNLRDMFRESGVEVFDDDVHVIVHRSDEIDVAPLRRAAQ